MISCKNLKITDENIEKLELARFDAYGMKTDDFDLKNTFSANQLRNKKYLAFGAYLEDKLVGPTAVIMSNEDYLEPSKAIYEFTKNNDYYKIKGGVIEDKVMTAEEIITLAKLPSRETLLSMLAGALLANISKFAVALDQVRIQKEENSTAETTAEA